MSTMCPELDISACWRSDLVKHAFPPSQLFLNSFYSSLIFNPEVYPLFTLGIFTLGISPLTPSQTPPCDLRSRPAGCVDLLVNTNIDTVHADCSHTSRCHLKGKVYLRFWNHSIVLSLWINVGVGYIKT